jgi:hypothetical protein
MMCAVCALFALVKENNLTNLMSGVEGNGNGIRGLPGGTEEGRDKPSSSPSPDLD